MNFHVGQKVVCWNIDRDWPGRDWRADRPTKGAVYTVVGLVDAPKGSGLLLEEIKNTPAHLYAFAAWRFRPVKTTCIDVFTAMLAPMPSAPARKKEHA